MECTYQGRCIRLPDFLVPGAARSGTTALYEHLRRHPDVFMPDEKEPMFFSVWRRGRRKEWQNGRLVTDWSMPDLDDYLDLFATARPDQICGEGSVWYLYDHEEVIRNIRTLYGHRAEELNIVILLRNPVKRAWSHYLLKRSRLKEPCSFEEAIRPDTIQSRLAAGMCPSYDYIGFGLYARQVRAWLAAFPNTRVWIHEEFYADPDAGMREVASFLGIPFHDALAVTNRVNASGSYRSAGARFMAWWMYAQNPLRRMLKHLLPAGTRRAIRTAFQQRALRAESMPDSLRAQLAGVYEPDIRELETVLGRPLDIWRQP